MTLAIIDLYVRKQLPCCGTHVRAFRETPTQGTKLPGFNGRWFSKHCITNGHYRGKPPLCLVPSLKLS